jgi:AraC-like DNA-binding protein
MAPLSEAQSQNPVFSNIFLEILLFQEPLEEFVDRLSFYRKLKDAWDLLEIEYSNSHLSLRHAARTCGVNQNHLNYLFRSTTGLTFHQLICRYRVLKSGIRVRDEKSTILEIAIQGGFGSLSSLERNFQKFLGISPAEFRTRIRGEDH